MKIVEKDEEISLIEKGMKIYVKEVGYDSNNLEINKVYDPKLEELGGRVSFLAKFNGIEIGVTIFKDNNISLSFINNNGTLYFEEFESLNVLSSALYSTLEVHRKFYKVKEESKEKYLLEKIDDFLAEFFNSQQEKNECENKKEECEDKKEEVKEEELPKEEFISYEGLKEIIEDIVDKKLRGEKCNH